MAFTSSLTSSDHGSAKNKTGLLGIEALSKTSRGRDDTMFA